MTDTESSRGVAGRIQVGELQETTLESSLGGKLRVQLAERLLQVTDMENPQYFFKAAVGNNGRLRFEVRTKNERGQYHPDLYARDLYQKALQHFSLLGVDTSSVTSVWARTDGLNDNFTVYRATPSRDQKNSRVLATPEGKILSGLHYEPMKVEDSEANEVVVMWSKKTEELQK